MWREPVNLLPMNCWDMHCLFTLFIDLYTSYLWLLQLTALRRFPWASTDQNKPQRAWEYLAQWGDQSPKSAQPPAPNSTLAALCHEHKHATRNPKPRNKVNPLLFAKISTGDPSGRSQGQPLNCQAGPWTNTATTRSLEHTEGWTWAQPGTLQSPAVLNRHGCFFYRAGQHI